MTAKYSEKDVQKLVRKTLFCGVIFSAALLIAGFIFGRTLIVYGLLLLLITPIVRVIMLVRGYARLGFFKFALAETAVFVLFAAAFILGGI